MNDKIYNSCKLWKCVDKIDKFAGHSGLERVWSPVSPNRFSLFCWYIVGPLWWQIAHVNQCSGAVFRPLGAAWTDFAGFFNPKNPMVFFIVSWWFLWMDFGIISMIFWYLFRSRTQVSKSSNTLFLRWFSIFPFQNIMIFDTFHDLLRYLCLHWLLMSFGIELGSNLLHFSQYIC